MNFSAGRFEIDISGPYPCFVRLECEGQEIHGIDHRDLRDLLHCVKGAMRSARQMLGGNEMEV
jgi:hypothetical protein